MMRQSDEYDFAVSYMPREETTQAGKRHLYTRADLSGDQQQVYDIVKDWRRNRNGGIGRQYLKVGGYAGTGKTTLTAALARDLENEGEHIAFAAFTGKAVNVLARKLSAAGVYGQCTTLHSLMYRPRVGKNGGVEGWAKVESLPCSMVIVDEASMIGAELWSDLVSYGLPILAVGDHGQLPPVGNDVVNLMESPDLRLERIHRQAEGNPILALAQWVREGKSHMQFEPTDARVKFIQSFMSIADVVATDPNNIVGICYTNRTRASMNRMIRDAAGRKYQIPLPDDVVVCLRNKKPIFNGMRGVISYIDPDIDSWGTSGASIDFPDDRLHLVTKLHLPQFGLPKTIDKLEQIQNGNGDSPHSWNQVGMLFDYGYALTAHKAQGSQYRDVIVVYENLFRDSDMRNRWLYTAFTRATDNLTIVRPQ